MFDRILIANRGEIACRVARTARRMGVATVAVYSDADRDALHVESCDEAVRIGPPPPRESYLNGEAIIAAALAARAKAIHPGYGFLSENGAFAAACAHAGIVFIGPPPAAIAAMGSKSEAKTIMSRAGVAVVPGYLGEDQDPARLAREAAAIGWPVLIKATAGGGGKGMKVAASAGEFAQALASAKREASASFGDDRVLLERYLSSPRHIEIQVFADAQGNAVYLFERDCSVQRRHQKVIEEAPAPGLDPARRRSMGEAAVAAAKAIGYVGAGTVEFIAEQDGTFYFMEMNTRLQVEHPVTEMITGLDLVEWQLRVAAGERLPRRQDELAHHGHAIEARIYAEDPERGFLPSIGRVAHWRMPAGSSRVRVDTGFRAGDTVTPFYDPMLAKVIAWGEDRDRARQRLLAALDGCEVVGVATNTGFLERVIGHAAFASARLDTGLIDAHRDALLPPPAPASPQVLIAAAVGEFVRIRNEIRGTPRVAPAEPAGTDRWSPWNTVDAWWNASAMHHLAFRFADALGVHECRIRPRGDGCAAIEVDAAPAADVRFEERAGRLRIDVAGDAFDATVVADGEVRAVHAKGARTRLRNVDPLAQAGIVEEHGGRLTAPMAGTVVAVLVKPGDAVAKGAPLIVLEAMKMEHTIAAPAVGRVVAVHFGVGDRVGDGASLVELDGEPPAAPQAGTGR
ncbi:MAG: acetyl-CoA carboxylase biotin carboxylase subunit [Proteobacteria bacterium]|nr:acetyl-CoA carboxylase biotin carboxylase subunit [Pseudomonadota bacterium]